MHTLRGASTPKTRTSWRRSLLVLAAVSLVVSACGDIFVTEKPDTTRFGTAATLATEAFPNGADVALLANGSGFADALAAAPLASFLNAPILLTQRGQIPDSTDDALDDLGVEEVVLLGGTGAIGEDVEATLVDQFGVTRHAGDNRYQTAATLAREAFPSGSDVALLATGRSFADALAAAPLAASLEAPILLTDRGEVPSATLVALVELGVQEVVLLGGTGVISQQVEDALAGGPFEVSRQAGAGRYETAAALAQAAFPDGADVALIANGEGFADALAAAPLAESNDAPILLTAQNELPDTTLGALEELGVSEVVLLGGSAAIAEELEDALDERFDVTRHAGE